MKKILSYLKNNLNLVLIFFISLILSLPNVISICSEYLNFNSFDLQAFLTWNYASINNYTPYKDFFYPYGLLSYYKNYNLFSILLYYLLAPILFTVLFFLFQKIFKDKLSLYFSFFAFLLFILFVSGFYDFSRYGVFVILSLLLTYIQYHRKNISNKIFTFVGIILGLIFSLANDLGSYLIISFFLIFIFKNFIQEDHRLIFAKKYLVGVKRKLFNVVLGLFLGFIPVLMYLLYNNSLLYFYSYFQKVNEVVITAKAPFIPFITSSANIFSIIILIFTITYIIIKMLFFKKTFTLSSFFQLTLVIDLLILEQKSIIRSIDQQITFIALLLYILIIYELINLFRISLLYKKIIYLLVLLLIIILYSFNVGVKIINVPSLLTSVSLAKSNKCFENNIKHILSKNKSYEKVTDYIKDEKNVNSKIFSFPPGNSIFYVLLEQKLPRFFSIYEAQGIDAQKTNIAYIKQNNIDQIILDTNHSLIGDGVPDYIRTPILFSYLLKNYYPEFLIDGYLILNKTNNFDFFNSKLLNKTPDFKQYLINVNLNKIPYSEGLYKYKFIVNEDFLIKTSTLNEVNPYLQRSKVLSKDKVFVLTPFTSLDPNYITHIKIYTRDGYSSIIYYNACKKNYPCILNLNNIPLFYKEREITGIDLDNKFKGEIKIYSIKNPSKLW